MSLKASRLLNKPCQHIRLVSFSKLVAHYAHTLFVIVIYPCYFSLVQQTRVDKLALQGHIREWLESQKIDCARIAIFCVGLYNEHTVLYAYAKISVFIIARLDCHDHVFFEADFHAFSIGNYWHLVHVQHGAHAMSSTMAIIQTGLHIKLSFLKPIF